MMKSMQSFKKTSTASYYRIQMSPPDRWLALGFSLLLLILPTKTIPNPGFWDLSNVSMPVHKLTGDYDTMPTGPTVFGINIENPSGTTIGYTRYTSGFASGGHDSPGTYVNLMTPQVRRSIAGNMNRRPLLGPNGFYGTSLHHYKRIVAMEDPASDHIVDGVANNHNGLNHVWIGDKFVAFHNDHLRAYRIKDVDTGLVSGVYSGELPHVSFGGRLYVIRDNTGMLYREQEAKYPKRHQGVFLHVHKRPSSTETTDTFTRVISKERLIQSIQARTNFSITAVTNKKAGGFNHADPSPSGDKLALVYGTVNKEDKGFWMDVDWPTYQIIVELKDDPNEVVQCTYYNGGNAVRIDSPAGDIGGCVKEMGTRPFHALWFDNNFMLAARPRVKRVDMNGSWAENLGNHAAHQGMSSDAQWYASDMAPRGEYQHGQQGTEILLHKRGQGTPVATFARWWNKVTWKSVGHANPSFSADGNRLYFMKGRYSSDYWHANMHYVDLTAYRKTLHKYCGAGMPWKEAIMGDGERHLKLATLTRFNPKYDVNDVDEPQDNRPHDVKLEGSDGWDPDAFFSHSMFNGKYLYGMQPNRLPSGPNDAAYRQTGETFPPHGYDTSPDHVWENPPVLQPGRTYVLEMQLSHASGAYGVTAAVDWNQNGWFNDPNVDNEDWEIVDETDNSVDRVSGAEKIAGNRSFNARGNRYDEQDVVRIRVKVPRNAPAGDTLMRVRVHTKGDFPNDGNGGNGFCNTWDGVQTHMSGGSAIYDNTATYDFPIVVKIKRNSSNTIVNHCVGTGATGNSLVDTTWNGWGAVGAVNTNNSATWSVEGNNEWVKKCFSSPKRIVGAKLDFTDGNQKRSYKFDIEGLHAQTSRWVKLIENGRSLGLNRDKYPGGYGTDAGYDVEHHYFAPQVTGSSFAAIRYVGYGNDAEGDGDVGGWNNLKTFSEIRKPSNSNDVPLFFGKGDTFVASDSSEEVDEDAGIYQTDITAYQNHGMYNYVNVEWSELGSGQVKRSQGVFKFGLRSRGTINGARPAEVERATLRIRVLRSAGGVIHSLYKMEEGWNEKNITAANLASHYLPSECPGNRAPPTDLPGRHCWLINSFQVPGDGQWLEVDVTEAVNRELSRSGDDTIAFLLSQAHIADKSLYVENEVGAPYGATYRGLPRVSYYGKSALDANWHVIQDEHTVPVYSWPQLTYVLGVAQ